MTHTETSLAGIQDCKDLKALVEISGALRRAIAETGDGESGRPWAGIHGLSKLLVHACRRHIEVVEAEGGFLTEIESRLDRPRALVLMRNVHRKLLEDAEALEVRLRDQPAETALKWEVQPMVRQFHEDMEKHEALEVDLIQETFRDVGVGD
jgi:hypothetical protein